MRFTTSFPYAGPRAHRAIDGDDRQKDRAIIPVAVQRVIPQNPEIPRRLYPKASYLYQPGPHRVADQPGRRIHVELAHRGGPVRLRRLDAEVQDGADALVAIALRHQLDDELLPRGERLPAVHPGAQSTIQFVLAAPGTERLVRQERLDCRQQ